MTLFDLITVVIILVSAMVGFTRGAVRELVTVFAFTLAAMAAVWMQPLVGPLFRGLMRPSWAANVAALVVIFIAAYIAFRLAGGWVTRRLHSQAVLGTFDRSIGLGFGVFRALVFLGVFYLVFSLATPTELVPPWIANGRLLPLAKGSAELLQVVTPHRGALGPALERVVTDDDPAPAQTSRQKPTRSSPGYDKRSRDDIDALVEKSR